MPVQIVIDTNVLVAAARSNTGASFEVLRLFAAGDNRWQWNISTALFLEYYRNSERFGLKVLTPAEFLRTL